MKKRVFMIIMALSMLSVVTPILAAPAIKIPASGDFLGSPTYPGEMWITEDGIMHIKGAVGVGILSGDLPGTMEFTLSCAIDLNTGEGSMHGKWVFNDDFGTFKGSWRTDNWEIIYYEGSAVGHGTGAYEGMVFRNTFWGYNLYLIGYEDPDGVYFEYDGTILSPKGIPLP